MPFFKRLIVLLLSFMVNPNPVPFPIPWKMCAYHHASFFRQYRDSRAFV